eukprot:gene1006-245_t
MPQPHCDPKAFRSILFSLSFSIRCCFITVEKVDLSPFQWQKVQIKEGSREPRARVYHAADVCTEGPAHGMMVIFGGRTDNNSGLKDIWGLRQHRDGRWDWVEAPTKSGPAPEERFQHSCIFWGSKFLVIGGRKASTRASDGILPTAVYDTETCTWTNISAAERFRHSSWLKDNQLWVCGGFDHGQVPTNTLRYVPLDRADEHGLEQGMDTDQYDQYNDQMQQDQMQVPDTRRISLGAGPDLVRISETAPAADEVSSGIAHAAAGQVHVVQDGHTNETGIQQVNLHALAEESRKVGGPLSIQNGPAGGNHMTIHDHVIDQLLRPHDWAPPQDPLFFLGPQECFKLLHDVRQVFEKETMLLELTVPIKIFGDIHGQFNDLMRLFARYKAPNEEGDIDSLSYLFLGDYVDRGGNSLEVIVLLFALKIKYPGQIFMIRGNHEDPTINQIYGFREELIIPMLIFSSAKTTRCYKTASGCTACLIRLPGWTRLVAAGKCCRRFPETDAEALWQEFNRVFEWLPCGAVIQGNILCIHGGIGGSLNGPEEIAKLERPLVVAQVPQTDLEQKITDLLWSDPSDSDNIKGVSTNETRDPDGTGRIVKFGPDRVEQFLATNNLSMIIRAHECVMDGFERFAGGKLITLFSATDYCGHHKNAGALLFVRRDLTIVPKLIYPVEQKVGNGWNDRVRIFQIHMGKYSSRSDDAIAKALRKRASGVRNEHGELDWCDRDEESKLALETFVGPPLPDLWIDNASQ